MTLNRRPHLDDLDREIREHIEAETEDNIGRGMSEEEARLVAVRKFGNVARVKEDVREVWIPAWVDQVRQDIRDAARHVRRNPAFSFAVILTLALGLALTTAIYSVVNAVLWRPLSYANPDRVVSLLTRDTRFERRPNADGPPPEFINSIDFAIWKSQATSLSHMVAYNYLDATLVAGGEASRMRIVVASDGFWEVTGAQPILGALPAGSETEVLVLTHQAFREQFGGDPQVIGRAVSIDGRQMTIGAVLPGDFHPQLAVRAWTPSFEQATIGAYRMLVVQSPPATIGPNTSVQVFTALGELKAGVTLDQARAEIELLHDRRQKDHPNGFGTTVPVVMPLRESLVGSSRLALTVLLAAAVCVLLITCANVANLLFSRLAARRKEIALRMSVGSGPLRVVRQLLAESLAYALNGAAGGLVLASWLIDAVIALMGPAVPRLAETTLDVSVLAVAFGAGLVTALLFGVGPAVMLCRTNVQEVLKEGGRSVSASRTVLLTGRTIGALQVALTIILLAGAGLMFKSVWRMTSHPPGFHPDQILTMRMDFRGPQLRDERLRHELAERLLAHAKTLPGVRQAALTTGRDSTMIVIKEGEPVPEDRQAHSAPVSSVSAEFGPMLGMSMVAGRWFDEVEASPVILINESLARREYPDRDPLGARIRLPWLGPEKFGTVVGVVSDLKYASIDTDVRPEIFFHHTAARLFGITLVLAVDGDPVAAAPAIRKALAGIDPTQSFYSVRTMEQALAESIAPRRFTLFLLGAFALVALVLAVLGVYGVVAYAVAERTQEIGIRLALGAQRGGVVAMIVRQGMLSVTAGIAAGVAGAVAATRLISGLLYGVEAHDVPTFVATTTLLAAVAFVACAAPALKAALVDPVVALRAE